MYHAASFFEFVFLEFILVVLFFVLFGFVISSWMLAFSCLRCAAPSSLCDLRSASSIPIFSQRLT